MKSIDVNTKITGAYIERKITDSEPQIRLNYFENKWMCLKEAKDHLMALQKAIDWMEYESD